jgi:asparagine synthase (glutamine-hydrolysing)
MCGICGVVDFAAGTDFRERIGPMVRSLHHRGPDASGTHVDSLAALGHTRLSIIDLSPDGRQPMSNEDGTVWVTFNGEIYNFAELRQRLIEQGHIFRSRSDTEVLVHLWEQEGEQSVQRLRGMFAYAIWETHRRRLSLVRDRLGIKPLYYTVRNGRLIFGSEIKAILAHGDVPRRLRADALSDYLTFMYVPAPKTMFQDICKLPAGHLASFDRTGLRVRQYWDLEPGEPPAGDEAAIRQELLERLQEAVRMRLVADVPLGAFLSGGVDSSAVVAMMSRCARGRVTTVSVGFPQKQFDELPAARRVAQRYATTHHQEMVDPQAADAVRRIAWHYDEPFADYSAVPTFYVSQAARRHVTVALSGDGGDENFGGYRRYRFDLLERRLRRLLTPVLRMALVAPLAAVYPKADWLPRPLRARQTLRELAAEPAEAYCLSVGLLDERRKARLLHGDLRGELAGYRSSELIRGFMAAAAGRDDLQQLLYTDIKTYLVDDILTKVDRASMAVALEVRVPLLDHSFVEFAHAVPSRLKVRGGQGKRIFKDALSGLLDEDTLRRPKQGFMPPLAQWLAGPLAPMVHDLLLAPGALCGQWLNRRELAAAWRRQQSGTSYTAPLLWTALMLELWARQFLSASHDEIIHPPALAAAS